MDRREARATNLEFFVEKNVAIDGLSNTYQL